jgi:acetyl esterase/lipase
MQIYNIFVILVLNQVLNAQISGLMGMKDIQNFPVPNESISIQYGKAPKQMAYLRILPIEEKQPLIVIIHGGCWVSAIADYQFMEPFAAAMFEAGYATYNLEYRSLGDIGGGHPGTFDDIQLGINFLESLSNQYPIDLQKVILVGHSAGGHLALWSALSGNLSFQPKGIISLAGIVDLFTYFDREGNKCGSHIDELMGGLPEKLDSVYRAYSPVFLPVVNQKLSMVHGAKDPIVPIDHIQSFISQGQKENNQLRSVIIEEAGHFELVAPSGYAWEVILNEILLLISE